MRRRLAVLACRVREIFGRSRFDRKVRDELDTYLAMSEAEHRAAGRTAAEARRAARLELGGLDTARQQLTEQRTGAGLDALWQDVRLAARRMRHQPGFTAIAVLTLGLGMGASTAVVSVVRSVIAAPLPFRDSDRLVRLRILSTDASGRERQLSLAPIFLDAIRQRSLLVERAAAQRFQDMTMTGGGDPERVVATAVTDHWIETIGVQPVVGRPFTAAEERQGSAARVALIGHTLWQRRFDGRLSAVGAPIRLDDRVYTIVGVMPPQFRYPYESELWFPTTLPPGAPEPMDLNAPARMRAGVTVARLNDELAGIMTDLIRERGLATPTSRVQLVAVPMREEFARDPNRSIAALSLAVAFVLLLTCVNLATLLMARGTARAREMAVRTALGAGRTRLVRQLMTESVLLALAGGMAGVAIAWSVRGWLTMLIPPRLGEVIQIVEIDAGVLAAAATVCVLTGLLFGLMPAWRQTRSRAVAAMRDGGRAGSSGRRALDALVMGELALATVLLIGAGLATQNVMRLLAADVGYDPVGLIRIHVGLSDPAYGDPARRTRVLQDVVERVSAVPGVRAAGVTSLHPVPRVRRNMGTTVALGPAAAAGPDPLVVNRRLVLTGYFDALGIRLLAGRPFLPSDHASAEPVAIINQAAARRFFGDADPIGQPVRPAAATPGSPWHRIVGVVPDIAEPDDASMRETLYQPYAQASHTLPAGMWITTSAALLVRLDPRAPAGLDGIYRAVWAVDPAMPLFETAAMDAVLEAPLGDQRLGAVVFASFGAFGLLLAMLGVYGVLAYVVNRRMSEFGVRLALGAQPSHLLADVLSSALRLTAVGLAVGLASALVVSRALTQVLTAIDPTDARTFVAGALALAVAATVAGLPPAVRAMRSDPIRAIRGTD
jgi:predicted permease